MKKIIFTAIIAFFMVVKANAQFVEQEGILYAANGNYATLMKLNPNSPIPDTLVIPSHVTMNGQEYPVTLVGERAFYMTLVKNVVLPSTIDSIAPAAFQSCSNLTSIVIPEKIRTIASTTFKSCSRLSSLQLPQNLKAIDDNAFYRCSSLTEVVIPDQCFVVGEVSFSECRNLKSITIGSSVRIIDYHALYFDDAIQEITIKAVTPPQLVDTPDENLKGKKLIVPAEALSLYQKDEKWNKFSIVTK